MRARRVGRVLAPIVLLLAGVLATPVFTAAPAGAHGADGRLGIEVSAGPAPFTAKVRVLLEYANDRDVAPGASVSATATGPEGRRVDAVPLADLGRGVYEATLTVPAAGAWTVTVTAVGPAATASADVTVPAPGVPPSGPTSSGPPPTQAPGDVRASSDRAERRAGEGGADDEGGSTGLVIAALVVIAIGAVVGGVIVSRRRGAPATDRERP